MMAMAQVSDDAVETVLPLSREDQTLALGRRLAGLCRVGDVIALRGDLGMGKTVVARGFIQARCNTEEEVPSPTFTLVQPYEAPDATIYHFDLYRLKSQEEAFELGIEDAFADGISLIEWPDRLGTYLPRSCLTLRLTSGPDGNDRRASLSGDAAWTERLRQAGLASTIMDMTPHD